MTKVSKMLTVVIMAITLFANSFSADAVPAYPGLISFVQPDGSTLRIYLKGDEKVKWAETEDGYSILFNAQGYYEYAVTDTKGDMNPSEIIAKNIEDRTPANLSFLSTITKHNRFSASQVSMAKQIWNISTAEKNGAKSFPTTGTRKLLCLLIQFTDKSFTKTQANFNSLFNQVNYNSTGSVYDYFYESSYNQLSLTVDVAGPFTASNNMAYYGANTGGQGTDTRPQALMAEAVNLADPTVNFANYDNDNNGTVDGIYVIYAGFGEESGASTDCIWAHHWSLATPLTKDGKTVSSYSCSSELSGTSGTNITNIGVICHEFGHTLGAPDFYDTDYDDTGNGEYDGTGEWDLQAGGSWNGSGSTFALMGNKPAQPNAYTKCYIYNWANPTILTTGATVTLNNSAQNANSFYRFDTPTSNEYFLLENRQQVGFDTYNPGHGLLIYHVDGTYISAHSSSNDVNNTSHQGMFIIPATSTTANGIDLVASSKVNTTGCPYPGTGSKTSFTDATTPNSKSWASANTAKPITSITENTTNKTVTLNFMGGNTCTTPTTQATAYTSTAITNTTMTIGWTRGNGTAVLVVAKASSAVNNDPFNGTSYTANAAFGSGTQIGTGNYVVYSGTGTSVNVTGLNPGTAYYFAIYEYTLATSCYKTPALTGNATTTGTAPCSACVPTSTSDDATGITNVTFSTINNTSTGDNAYTDNSATIASVSQNQVYPLSVKVNTAGNYTVNTKAWIDWNHDCTFDAATEEYNLGTASNVTNGLTGSSPLSITIPSSALTGNTKMRIRATYYDGTILPTACNDQSYSEAEDYTLNVVAGACTPVAVTTQPATTQSACAPGGASFTVAATTGTAPINYQWQYYNGSTWNNVTNGTPAGATYTNGTASTMTVAGITASATYQYKCYLTNCSGANNATSNTASLVINALPTAPTIGTITQPTCATPTGSVVLNGLPATGTWTLTRAPGGTTTTGTGTSKTITNLAAGTYTYTVTNANTCVSPASSNIVITTAAGTPNVVITNNTGSSILTCSTPSISVTATPAGATSYSWNSGTSTTTASNSFTSAGTYTVTVSANGGCTATSSISITQNTTPPTVTLTNNGPICTGNNLNLTGNGGANYAWSGPNSFTSNTANPTITGATAAAAGLYTATVTGTNGCTGTGQTTVVVNPIPVSQFTYNTSGLTVTFTNTSTNATSYSWNFGSGTSTTASPVYTFPSNGQYTVTLTANTQGCSSTSTQIINVVGDGIATNSSQHLTIYPNPAHGLITIQLDAESNTKLLSIFDVTGRMVYQKSLHSSKEDINLSHLNYGVYEVKINLDNRVLHQRLILK